MKQLILLFSFIFLFSLHALSQNDAPADKLQKQAQEFSEQKEFTKARYFYIKAYEAFCNRQDFSKAVDCGSKAATLYYRESYYKEAFDLCRVMEQVVLNNQKNTGKSTPELRYKINKVRFQMYLRLKRPEQSKQYLNVLQSFANTSGSEDIGNDYLYTEATYYYSFGMTAQGDAAFKTLIEKYKSKKNYAKVSDCYKTLIGIALRSNNAGLVSQTYEKYIVWTDSVKALTAKDELSVMKRKYDASVQTIQDKEGTLSLKNGIIWTLVFVIAVLAAALILGAILYLRTVMQTKKQKKIIEIANEHNSLKTQFIQNISAQMEPTLNTLDASHPGVVALHSFSKHIQELSQIEDTMADGYEMSDTEVGVLSERIVNKIKTGMKKNITIVFEAPRQTIQTNPEQLERILFHLLSNAVEYTDDGGKIWFEFKKRGAHSYQFIVTDTGKGISAEAQENLFKPFTEIKNIANGDGLGLPICSLIATKMNGSLTLDKSYVRGCRFVLDLHA